MAAPAREWHHPSATEPPEMTSPTHPPDEAQRTRLARPPLCARCERRLRGVFCALAPPLLVRLSGKSAALFRRGQVVFHEGTEPLACYCIHSGRVKLFRTGLDGKEQIVAVAGPSELIGHHALFSRRSHTVTAQMLEDGYLCVIERAAFLDLVRQSSPLVVELLRRAVLDLEAAQERLADRSYRSARSRLAAALLRLWEEKEAQAPGRPLVLTRQDLADLIGAAQETAIRMLTELKRLKAVSVQGGRITVLRPDLLRARSQPPY